MIELFDRKMEKIDDNEMETTDSIETTSNNENLLKFSVFNVSEKIDKVMKIEEKSNNSEESVTPNGNSQIPEEQSLSPSIKVYVRLKPYPTEMKLAREQESAYQILDQQSLFFNLLKTNHSMYNNKYSEVVGRKFSFSQAFDPSVNQGMIFDHVIKPQLANFFGGQNCTVMTYGTMDSGKSYTLEGSFANPGLIPRTLQHIFFLKNPRAFPNYKPMENKVEVLNEAESLLEVESRKEILSSLSENSPDGVISCSKALKRLDEQLRLAPVEPTDIQQEVWVSYAEIRDETFYDLLSPEYNQGRYPLKLVANCEEQPFVKGLRYVSVGTAADAWDALIIGRNNLKKLNMTWDTRSSKSHCIFNIVFLEYHDENNPEKVQISRFSFCDLAAQESPNIDSSLLSLTESLKVINDNKSKNVKTPEYFCQSKLTRLFQKALTGEESLSIVVNVNPLLNLYKETMSVLHSTSIDNEVLTKSKRIGVVKLSTKFGKIVAENIDNWDDLTSTELAELSSNFKGEVTAIKALSLRTDIQAREKIINKYTAMIERLSIMQKKREKNNPKPEKKSKKRKLSNYQDRLSDFEDIGDDTTTEDDELKIMVQKMRTQKQMMQRELTQSELQLTNLLIDVNVNHSEELTNAKDLSLIVCDKTIECKNNELRINTLVGLLNEAKNDVTKLCNELREKDKKYSELERKYSTIKLDRERDSIIHSNTNYAFKVKCEMLEILEYKLDRERELRQLYQDKFEKLNDSRTPVISPIKIDKSSTVDQSTSTDAELLKENGEVSMNKSTEVNDNSVHVQSLNNVDIPVVDGMTDTLNNSNAASLPSEFDKGIRVDEIEKEVTDNSAHLQSLNYDNIPVTNEMNDTLNNSNATSLPSESGTGIKVNEIYEEVKFLKSQMAELVKKTTENNDGTQVRTSYPSNGDTKTDELVNIKIDNNNTISDVQTERSNSLRRSTRKRRSSFLTERSRSRSRKRSKSKDCFLNSQQGRTHDKATTKDLVITCDNCESVIIDGHLYHCKICRNDDFDLCPDCFNKIGHGHEVETRPLDN